jgi:subtilisin-like proprotein convertase family protein
VLDFILLLPKKQMKITTLFVLLNFFAWSQTSIPAGAISGTWNISGSPYLVQGSIIVPDGQTLTINPGVQVIFQGNYQLFVQGRILAQGIAGDSITFTANNVSAGWLGIRFDNTPITNDTSRINYCRILYGINLNVLSNGNGGGVYVNNFSKLTIDNSLFQYCKTSCSGCNGSNGNGAGLYSNSVLSIRNSSFKNNQATTGGNGGGIWLITGDGSKIINCLIKNNSAFKYGGIWSQGTIIDNCTISYNTTVEEVGGVYIGGINSKLTNSTVTYNSAGRYGGGVVCQDGLVNNNTITNNSTGSYGGGISGRGTITNNIISNNTSSGTSGDHGGGGIAIDGSSIVRQNTIKFNQCQKNGGGILSRGGSIKGIVNNYISNNQAIAAGGGVHFGGNFGSSADSLIGNVIANNTATNGGAIGISSNNSAPKIWNNTIVNNSATNGGAFYAPTNNSPEFKNCIIRGNTATQNGPQFYLTDQASQPTVYNSNVQGGNSAFFTNGNFYLATYQNNIDQNPIFINPSAGSGTFFDGTVANWRLQSSSPCINAGISIGNNPSTDIDGNTRTQGLAIDMGAYEINSLCINPTIPIFTQMGPYCLNSPSVSLLTTSNNSITGTWNPSTVSTGVLGSQVYTFTPSLGLCASATQMNIVITSNLTVTVNNPSVCSGSAATVTATPGVPGTYNYAWTVPAGVTNPGNVASFSTTIAGTYSVFITNTATNCISSSASGIVTINPTPNVNAGPDLVICAGASVTLTGSGAAIYTWNNGVSNGVSFAPATTTTYTVTGTSPGNCISTDQVIVTVNPPPNVNAGLDQSVCFGTSTSLTATGGVAYSWNNGLGSGNNFSVSPLTTTTYTVTGTNANGCTGTDQVIVTVNPPPNVNAGIDQIVCAGSQIVLSGSGATTYSWNNGVSNGTPFAPGVGTMTYTVVGTNPNGCTSSDQVVVTVNPTPTVTVNNPSVCSGTAATVTATPSIPGTYNYTWTVPAGVTNPGNVASFSTTIAGTYSAVVTNQLQGCSSSSASGTVTLTPLAGVNAGPNQTVCAGSQIVLSGSGATTYSWNNGVVNNAPFTVNATTNYTLTGVSNGCTGTDQVLITVLPAPFVNAGVNQTICVGNQVVLSATGATTYSWNNGVTNGTPFSPGVGTMVYTVVGTNANGCTGSDQVVVTVNPGPQINAGSDITICPGDNVSLYIPIDTSTVVVASSSSGTYVADSSSQPYANTITVSGFPAGTQISTAADLQQVCFNFEHSFLGDLDIWLQCPTGQYVPLVNSYNLGTGGFLPGGVSGGSVFLGDPIDDLVGPPGDGWEYCFSSVNATSGIFTDNIFNTIPLTIANGNNSDGFSMDPGLIYLPETSFSALAGCPVNGNWTLFIQDEWQIDDGYVFDWSLDFGGTVNPGSVGTVIWNNGIINNVPFTPSTTTTYTATITTAAGCVGTDQVMVSVLPASACNNGNGNGTFSNATSPMPFQQANFVPTVIDHNNDGNDDVFGYILNQPNTNKLWINNGNSTFSDISASVNFPTRNNAMVADFDKNGYSDIYYKVGDSLLIYLNSNNTYQAAASPCGVQLISTLFGVAPTAHRQVQFNDFNNDGVHDLMVQIQSGNQSILKGIPGQLGCQVGCAFSFVGPVQTLLTLNTINNVYSKLADLDNDGDMDIMLGYGANQYQNTSYNLYENDGNGNFSQVTGSNYTAGRENAFGTVGELNNDGLPDIMSGAADCCIAGDPMYVHFSNTPMNYTVSTTALPRYMDPYYQRASLVDLNLDSRNDVVWVSMAAIGSSQLQYYVNNGNNTFTESSTLYNIHEGPLTGECCAIKNFMHAVVIDINCDRKPDLDIRSLDNVAPFTNTTDWVKLNGTANNALKLKLDACQGLREGWGAHLKFKTGGQWHYQQHAANTQDGYPFLYLGMGTNTMIDSLVIYWVGGNTSVLTNVMGNQYISVGETAFCSFGSAVNAQIQPNTNQTVCENDNYTLTANVTNAVGYQWFNNGQAIIGATNNTLVVNSTGNYSFIADNGTTCNVASDTVFIEALPTPDLALEILGGQDTLCDSECAYLLADGADQYYWFNGSSLDYQEVEQTGNYWVIGTGTNGCQQSDSINIWINTSTDTVLYVSAIDQYSLNGVTYYQSGIYIQTLFNNLGCDSTITLDLDLNFTGVENLEELEYSVFPNPTTNDIFVNSANEMNSPYQLLDSKGRLIFEGVLIGKSFQLSLHDVATGTYFLKITDHDRLIKVIKQ